MGIISKMMQQYAQPMQAQPMNMATMAAMSHGYPGSNGFGLMNLAAGEPVKAQTLAKKPAAKTAKKAEPKKASKATKKVTAASPGTKKVMEEISFEKPTWEDKKGFGWANLPFAGTDFAAPYGAFGFDAVEDFAAPFAAPYGAYGAGFEEFAAPFAAPYGAGFEAPFGDFGLGFDPAFGYAAPEFGFGVGAPFVDAVPEFGGYAGYPY